jgi:hypothetical protein
MAKIGFRCQLTYGKDVVFVLVWHLKPYYESKLIICSILMY